VPYGRLVDETDAVVSHYEIIREERRITQGLGQLELLRTQEIVRRFLPPPPASILDVGGGPGVHAAWLATDGYQPHVVDLTSRHVAIVEAELGVRGVTAEVGDARNLSQPDNSFDVTLLLGPLYHLTERSDRVRALSECARVVRPGGLVIAAAISRFASLFDGLARGFIFDDRFKAIVERDLRDGQHRNPADDPHWFTTAFFHEPDDLEQEATDAGLAVVSLLGVEGMAGWLASLGTQWETPHGRETILWSALATESDQALRGLSPHILLVARVSG
jgi:SAM-dependent methyltransferase